MKNRPASLTHRALGGMVWVAWGSGATAVLKVVVLVLLTRLLSPADFGVLGAALIVIGFSLNFSQLGVGPALVQRPVLEPVHITTALWASVGFGVFCGGLTWAFASVISGFFRMPHLEPVVRALAALFPVAGLSTVAESLMRRDLRFRLLANTDVLSYGLGYGLVSIVCAFLGWGIWALVAGQLAQALIRLGIVLWFAPPKLRPHPTWAAFQSLMDYGVGQSVGRVALFLANQADNFVAGRWLGATALGFYSRAYQLMAVPTELFGNILDRVLFPTMARVQDDARRLGSAYLQGTALIGLLTLPVGVVGAVLAPDLIAVAFGSRWMAAVPPFQILALGMMFRTSGRMGDSVSRATGNVYRRAWRQILYAGLVFLGALAGQRWGITGMAVGVLGALFVNYLLMAHLSLNVGQISWLRFVQAQLPALGMAIVLGAVALVVTTWMQSLGFPHLGKLIVGMVAVTAVAILLIWRFPAFALGEHGIRMQYTLRSYLQDRLRLPGSEGLV